MKIGSKNYQKGFTLLEMLLVIAMIAILAGIVIVAINPGRQLAQARNAQRASDLRAIHSAVQQYYIDNRAWPAVLDATEINGTMLDICKQGITDPSCLDLSSSLVPTYISAIPTDPLLTASANQLINTANAQSTNITGYRVGINPTSQTPNVLAVNSTEYDLEEVKIITPCGDPSNEACWSASVSINPATGEGYVWSNDTGTATGITSTTDGVGNTAALAALGSNYEAATYCAELTESGYPAGNWYLPAIDQLEAGIEAQVAGALSGFTELRLYWSSTESSTSPWGDAWDAVYWGTSVDPVTSTKDSTDYVRCLR